MAFHFHTLADIPQDLTGSAGQIFAADVHTFTASRKRKRSEIVTAIDHQGLNIYDVFDNHFTRTLRTLMLLAGPNL